VKNTKFDTFQHKDFVKAPISRTLDSRREVTFDQPTGLDKFNDFQPTNTLTVLTDKYGNLVTAIPGIK
jgi:hypothetical protein